MSLTFEERTALKQLIHLARVERAGVVQDGLLHGTLGCYRHHRCRCDQCRAAENAYRRTRSSDRRRATGNVHNAEKTHCKRGHPFDDENTRVDARGYRTCKACRRWYYEQSRVAA